jgi:acyl-CoA thioesterase-2
VTAEAPATGLDGILDIEDIGNDLFRAPSPGSVLQRVFGGQVAAQAIVCAARTVREGLSVHSLHAYFLRPGTQDVPVLYRVQRLRDGRTFETREVTGVQNGRTIFTLMASFAITQDGPDHQDDMPVVPGPDDLPPSDAEDARFAEFHERVWPDWDVRRVPPAASDAPGAARQQFWLRHRSPVPGGPDAQVGALTYASDLTLLACCRLPHLGQQLETASLDHAMWFLRPFRIDEWLLYDQTSPSAALGRGLNTGRMFDRTGALVASITQEGLLRSHLGSGYFGAGPWEADDGAV